MIWTTTKEERSHGLPAHHHVLVEPRAEFDDVFWSVHLEEENDDAGDHPYGGDCLTLEVYGSAPTVPEARRAAEQAYKRLCRLSRSYQNMAGYMPKLEARS